MSRAKRVMVFLAAGLLFVACDGDPVEQADVSLPDTGDELDADVQDDTPAPDEPWRSELFPEEWTPSVREGDELFLHDFSYAGYRYGASPVVLEGGRVLVEDVDTTGEGDATSQIQAAIDEAASLGGAVVELPAGLLRVDGLLTVTTSNVVLRGQGSGATRLWFTQDTGVNSRAHLTFRGSVTREAEVSLVADAREGATEVVVRAESAPERGDEVALGWVITEDFVADHEMTGIWEVFNGSWQPFFRRTVVDVHAGEQEQAVVTLDVPLRYPALVRDGASLRRESGYLREVGLEGLSVANATNWEQAWDNNQVHAVLFDGVADAWVRDVTSFVSPGAPEEGPGSGAHLQSGGIRVTNAKRVSVLDSTMEYPQHRGGGGNGYLFEVRQSSEVLFADCVGRAGRHNFIQNWGFGASGIVWLRVESYEGRVFQSRDATISTVGASEFHHSLAMASLIDSVVVDDAWSAQNRKLWSSGAGHSATGSVFWNVQGTGTVNSFQWDQGYVIGSGQDVEVVTDMPSTVTEAMRELWEDLGPWTSTWPEDYREGIGRAAGLEPSSLYEAQRALRLAREAQD